MGEEVIMFQWGSVLAWGAGLGAIVVIGVVSWYLRRNERLHDHARMELEKKVSREELNGVLLRLDSRSDRMEQAIRDSSGRIESGMASLQARIEGQEQRQGAWAADIAHQIGRLQGRVDRGGDD